MLLVKCLSTMFVLICLDKEHFLSQFNSDNGTFCSRCTEQELSHQFYHKGFIPPHLFLLVSLKKENLQHQKFSFLTAGKVNLESRILWNRGWNTRTFESPILYPQILLINSVREIRQSIQGSQKQILQISSSTYKHLIL